MHVTDDFLYLSDTALAALNIAPSAVADAIEAALRDKAAGRVHTTPKSAILPGEGRYMMSTLAVGGPLTVLKSVTVAPENPARNLPAINGAIVVMDAETGLLRAVMGANWITAVRTAALSAVAARRMANPKASSLAFIGTGIQARSHLDAFCDMFPITEIHAYGRGAANLDLLCQAAEAKGLRAIRSQTAEEAINSADIVVTSVTLNYDIDPFLHAGWLKPGAFAAITDLGIPWHQNSLADMDQIVIDDHAQEAESPRKMVPAHKVTADLTELVSGEAHADWEANKTSAFAFRGIAIGDYAAAALALDVAQELGMGQRIDP